MRTVTLTHNSYTGRFEYGRFAGSVARGEKSKNFMGSEFTNADITASNLDENTYKLVYDKTPIC